MEHQIIYSDVLKIAWKKLFSQIWLLAGLLIGFVIIYSLLFIFALPAQGETQGASSYLVMTLCGLLYALFIMGYMKNCFQTLDGDEPQFSAYGQATSKLLSLIVAGFIYFVVVTIGLALFVVPGIYLGLRLWFYFASMVDENTGIVASFKRSWEITRKQTLSLFVLAIIMIVVALIGTLSLIVGIFVAMPFMMLMYGYTFRKLTNPEAKN